MNRADPNFDPDFDFDDDTPTWVIVVFVVLCAFGIFVELVCK